MRKLAIILLAVVITIACNRNRSNKEISKDDVLKICKKHGISVKFLPGDDSVNFRFKSAEELEGYLLKIKGNNAQKFDSVEWTKLTQEYFQDYKKFGKEFESMNVEERVARHMELIKKHNVKIVVVDSTKLKKRSLGLENELNSEASEVVPPDSVESFLRRKHSN